MIKLQFATEHALDSALIRAYGHGWCSHVDAVLEDGNLLGARLAGGVAVRAPGYASFSRSQIVEMPCAPGIAEAFYGFVRSQVGKRYDLLAIAAFAVDRDWRDDNAWFCSELAGRALEVSRYFEHRLATQANRLTPPDLLLLCSTRVDIPLVA
jgi:hypothetical protein